MFKSRYSTCLINKTFFCKHVLRVGLHEKAELALEIRTQFWQSLDPVRIEVICRIRIRVETYRIRNLISISVAGPDPGASAFLIMEKS